MFQETPGLLCWGFLALSGTVSMSVALKSRLASLALAVALVDPTSVLAAETKIPAASITVAEQLRDRALKDNTGYEIVSSLTTEVGPREAGGPNDLKAVEWAKAKFKALGYDKVWTEPVTFPKWVRHSESARVLGANAQPLYVTALGGSAAGDVTGEVVRFESLEALQNAPADSLVGKIAFIDFEMKPYRDGRDYGKGSRIRNGGPGAAMSKGAIGFVMRSAGTDSHRFPHTGMTRYPAEGTPIPAAAMSTVDAEQLTRLLKLGPQQVHLKLDCGWDGEFTSYNVVGEITGRTKPKEYVVIGGHLDSWDLGTGAVDDGAGVAITMAAGALIGQLPKAPARTIRVIAFANEEQGLVGGKVYAANHVGDLKKHQIAAESDFGAGRIYAFVTSAPPYAKNAEKQILSVLAPLGIDGGDGTGGPGPDLIPFAEKGLAWASLRQDGTDYFHLHHTPDDTLDKIEPAALAQNVAAYAAFAYLAADAEGDFGSAPKPDAASGKK